MRIGELAERTGLTSNTIRYYEGIGLLPEPERRANGYRSYGDGTVDRLRFVRDAQSAGLSLLEINLILDLRDGGQSTCEHVISMLRSHLDDVDHQLEELTRTRQRLMTMIDGAANLDPTDCTDPNRCQTIAVSN